MGTVRPAPEGASTEADSWSAQSHPPIIELIQSNFIVDALRKAGLK